MTRADPVPHGAVARVLERVAADPHGPLLLGVAGPGGYGKTTVLGQLRERSGADLLVVDDAHRLGDDELRELVRLTRHPGARVAVAYRPWPRPAQLGELVRALREHITLTPFDTGQVARMLSGAGIRTEPGLVELVHHQTHGVPGLVRMALGAQPASGVPDEALHALRYDLDALPPDVQRYLLAADAGIPLDADLLGGLLGRDADGVAETIAAARASGLVGSDGVPAPMVQRAVALLNPVADRVDVRRRLAELQLDRGGPVAWVARSLLGTGAAGGRIAEVYEAAADEVLPVDSPLAARLYAAAAAAGRPVPPLAIRWARAAALAGDLDSALRIADRVIAAEHAADRRDGARIAAAALAHRGQWAHSAALYRWSDADSAARFAAIGLIGTGDLPAADDLLDRPTSSAPPALFDTAAALMARGVRESVTGTVTAALAALVSAADLLQPVGHAALLPDSPAALGALVALHAGELTVAESMLTRAISAGTGGPLMARRHQLLRAWTLMTRGETAPAERLLAGAGQDGTPRDRLLAVALDLALARRDNDLARLRRTWTAACEAVLRQPVDLFTLLPLGELTVCAARLGDHDRMAPHLADSGTLLHRLGDPPLWTAPLRWNQLHAAIVTEQPDLASESARALATAAPYSAYHRALSDAADRWVEVLAGTVDVERVDHAARGLHAIGLTADGAALAAQAAIRTADRKATAVLLDRARTLQGRPARAHPPTGAATPATDRTLLSDRELEVASLVVAGLTYKQIGDRLFISPKTIEHHVARIRQRLGCDSRADLILRLRHLVVSATAG
jgi:DNA-binding NarL/FixJ family response regulator